MIELLWHRHDIDGLVHGGRNPHINPDKRVHLGANIFAGVNELYEGVSVRKWYQPEGQNESLRPGQPGVLLYPDAWRTLYDILDNFIDYMPHHASDLPCAYTYENAQGMILFFLQSP